MPWKTANNPVTPAARRNARPLRRDAKEAEKRLWLHLRRRLPIEGSHFRRQVAIGPYVTDFCCHGARLIIEVDGGQHNDEDAVTYDNRRTEDLESRGYRVLRFSNFQVLREIDMVIDTIHAALTATPTPCPSPHGGGG